VREGATPAALAGIDVPADDWLELLDLAAAGRRVAERVSA
jgi:hypothetical protein